MQEQELEEQFNLGEEASRIYQSDLIQNFFSDTDKALWTAFTNSRPDDYEGRERIYLMKHLSQKFRAMFEQYIAGGKMATDMLKKVEEGAFNNL